MFGARQMIDSCLINSLVCKMKAGNGEQMYRMMNLIRGHQQPVSSGQS